MYFDCTSVDIHVLRRILLMYERLRTDRPQWFLPETYEPSWRRAAGFYLISDEDRDALDIAMVMTERHHFIELANPSNSTAVGNPQGDMD